MARFFVLALVTTINPTLLAAVTVMISLPRPLRLLLGYFAGAALISITCCLLITFTLNGTEAVSVSQHTVNPIINLCLGILILVPVLLIATGHDRPRREWLARRRERAKDKPPPRWKRLLSTGSASATFGVGVILSFPAPSQIAAMNLLAKRHYSTLVSVLYVVAFTLIMLVLLELPLIGYALRPRWTEALVGRFSAWLSRRGGRAALIGSGVVGGALILRALVNW